eukprot:117036-Amphidinium_carterae.1
MNLTYDHVSTLDGYRDSSCLATLCYEVCRVDFCSFGSCAVCWPEAGYQPRVAQALHSLEVGLAIDGKPLCGYQCRDGTRVSWRKQHDPSTNDDIHVLIKRRS